MSDPCAALKAGPSYDFRNNRMPKCPHCGTEYDISEHGTWDRLYMEGEHTVCCGSCDQDFNVKSEATWSFDTDEQEQS